MTSHSKPMAISTITSQAIGSPSKYPEGPPSVTYSSSSPSNSPNSTPPYASSAVCSSTPDSPERPYPFHRQRSTSGEIIRAAVIPTSSLSCPTPQQYQHHSFDLPSTCYNRKLLSTKTTGTISLDERRQRNKSASAKYRAKKNQKYIEMRSLIASLTKENELLMHQLDNIRAENAQLKMTCDRLRGKMLAERMLKHFLGNEKQSDRNGKDSHEYGEDNNLAYPADRIYNQQVLDSLDSDLDNLSEDDAYSQPEAQWKQNMVNTLHARKCSRK